MGTDEQQQIYRVRYQAGPYSGTEDVWAEDQEQAIAIVRARIRSSMTLSMYSESYRVIGGGCDGRRGRRLHR